MNAAQIVVRDVQRDCRTVVVQLLKKPLVRRVKRNCVSRETNVRVLVEGKMGPKEIGKLITLLEAEKLVLEDDEDEEASN